MIKELMFSVLAILGLLLVAKLQSKNSKKWHRK
jgi:hypothetical protein